MATKVIEGGERLLAALRQISDSVKRGGALKVGFLAGATYPNGTPVAMVAAIQNFGAPRAGIPPRPFFSNMVAEKSSGWPDEIRAQLKSTNFDARRAMGRMGVLIRGQLQQSIRDTNDPPLKPATVRRKGFAKPLIDTSHMINSVAYEYEER